MQSQICTWAMWTGHTSLLLWYWALVFCPSANSIWHRRGVLSADEPSFNKYPKLWKHNNLWILSCFNSPPILSSHLWNWRKSCKETEQIPLGYVLKIPSENVVVPLLAIRCRIFDIYVHGPIFAFYVMQEAITIVPTPTSTSQFPKGLTFPHSLPHTISLAAGIFPQSHQPSPRHAQATLDCIAFQVLTTKWNFWIRAS